MIETGCVDCPEQMVCGPIEKFNTTPGLTVTGTDIGFPVQLLAVGVMVYVTIWIEGVLLVSVC